MKQNKNLINFLMRGMGESKSNISQCLQVFDGKRVSKSKQEKNKMKMKTKSRKDFHAIGKHVFRFTLRMSSERTKNCYNQRVRAWREENCIHEDCERCFIRRGKTSQHFQFFRDHRHERTIFVKSSHS